jgi:hypothetical protein
MSEQQPINVAEEQQDQLTAVQPSPVLDTRQSLDQGIQGTTTSIREKFGDFPGDFVLLFDDSDPMTDNEA